MRKQKLAILFSLATAAVVGMTTLSQIPVQAAETTASVSSVGYLKSEKSRIYTAAGGTKSVVGGTKYTNEIFYVHYKKVVKDTMYYAISRQSDKQVAIIGWVKASSLKRETYKVVTNTKKIRYIKGEGKGYTRPAGGSRNVYYSSLTKFKNATFTNTMTVKVGSVTWYRGVVQGATVWLPSSALASKTTTATVVEKPVEQKVSFVGRIINTEAKLYTDVTKTSTTAIKNNQLSKTYEIAKKATYNKEVFYYVTDQGQPLGWVKASAMTTKAYGASVAFSTTMLLTGGGYGYSVPWGTTNNIVLKSLTSLKNTKLTVTEKATVGTTTWYKGTTETGKVIWVAGNRTTAHNAPVETATSVVARITDEAAKIYEDVTRPQSATVLKTTQLAYTFEVAKKATYNGQTYYLLTTNGKAIGWIAQEAVTTKAYGTSVAFSTTMLLTGGGYGYSVPWGTTNNIVLKSLTSLKNTKLTVTEKATVGTTTWYKGTTETGKAIWVAGNRTTAYSEPAAIKTTTTTINNVATLKSTAKIYPDYKAAATRSLTTGEMSETFIMKKKITYGTTDFYEVKRANSAGTLKLVGYVKVGDATLKAMTTATMPTDVYLTGKLKAYNAPATSAASNLLYDSLLPYIAQKLTVTEAQTIGGSTYYKGKIGSQVAWVQDTQTGNPYVAVNLRKVSNIKLSEMQSYLEKKLKQRNGAAYNYSNNVLYKNAQVFLDMEKKYGINGQFMLAHAIWETGWGDSAIAQYKNNFFGYQAYDSCAATCAMYFPTGKEGIQYYANEIYRKYLKAGAIYNNGVHIAGMNVRYATDGYWGRSIARLMQEMKPYDATYYNKAKISTLDPTLLSVTYSNIIPSEKPQPSTMQQFDAGVTATVNAATANARTLPYATSAIKKAFTKGTKITLEAYHTDVRDISASSRWLRVSVNGVQAWVQSGDLKINNLGYTMTDGANVRNKATTTNSTIVHTFAKKNSHFKLVTNTAGDVVTEKNANGTIWYKIAIPGTTKTGFISSTVMKKYP